MFYREVRETPWAITNHGIALGQKAVVFNSTNHKVEATVLTGRKWSSSDLLPGQYTGRIDYTDYNTGSLGFILADVVELGLIINTGFKYNLMRFDEFDLYLTGYFSKYLSVYGGPEAKYAVSLNFNIPLLGDL